MEIFYTVSMTLNAVCAMAIMFSGIQKQQAHFSTLALLNIAIMFLHYYSWQIHTAPNLVSAIEFCRHQTTASILALPLMTYTFAGWLNYQYKNTLTVAIAGLAIPLLLVNLVGDSSLRFLGNHELISLNYLAASGKAITVLTGEVSNLYNALDALFGVLCTAFAIFSWQQYKKERNKISLALFVLLVSQLFFSLVDHQISTQTWHFYYVSGLPLTVFSIICVFLISYLYKHSQVQLKKETAQHHEITQAIKSLASEALDSNNNSFYHHTTKTIQQVFNTQAVFIGLYQPNDEHGTIETLSVNRNGELADNFTYSLNGSPSKQVILGQKFIIENDADYLFPDAMLTDLGIKSYIGLPIVDNQKKPLGVLVLLHDVKYQVNQQLAGLLDVYAQRIGAELSRDKLAKKLKQVAYFDHITKLPNRAKLFEQINHAYQQGKQNQSNALLLLVDLDHFKEINTVYGYDIADEVLGEIGQRLKSYAGDDFFVARNGSDEFALVIENIEEKPQAFIELHWRAISAMIKSPVTVNDQEIITECSIGGVIFPLQTQDRFNVIPYAESALQQAKKMGRNQYAIFDENIQASFERKQILLKAVKQALNTNDELMMLYQPQTSPDGKLTGVESLIRWHSPEFGFISPAEFIPIIEQTELIHDLGYWIIKNVLKQMHQWQNTSLAKLDHVAINIAAKQLMHNDFINNLVKLCQHYQISPSQIVLELTESSILTDTDFAITSLSELKKHGFTIALDDFGTGYSSLSYLKDLPVDILKIDKSFIDDIFSASTKALIQSMFSIAHHLNLTVVTEGIESQAQVDELIAMGATCFQGYYYSKPLTSETLSTWRFQQ